MKSLFLPLLFMPFLLSAQEKGVHFEHGLSWAAVQAKAKAENKYIFMDCFTTWCGPCKYMSNTVFPQEVMGNYFNDKFISVKVQLDTTRNDNEEVKSWYADAHNIMTKYHVNAFPTFLIFAPDGRPVHRLVGGTEADAFISRTKESFDPDKQYYTLLAQYEQGKSDSGFLRKMALAALNAYDMQNAAQMADKYLATQQDWFTPTNIRFLDNFTRSSKDKGFAIFLNHPDKVDAAIGKGKANAKLKEIILQENVYPAIFAKDAPAPDWNALQTKLAAQYPQQAEEVIAEGQVMYYQEKNDWTNFQTSIVRFMQRYGQHASPEELNSYAWTVFKNCPDMNCVAEALEWSRRSFKDKENPMFMDTYANILYKMGKKDDAIAWEQKAMNLAGEGEKKIYQETLDKMKSGVKTWD